MKFKNNTDEKQLIRTKSENIYEWKRIKPGETVELDFKPDGFGKVTKSKTSKKTVETKQIEFKCDICGKSFTSKKGLKIHKGKSH